MRQAELASIVSGLKSDFSNTAELDQATLGDRANSANLAALDMVLDAEDTISAEGMLADQARALKSLSGELRDITGVIAGLGGKA